MAISKIIIISFYNQYESKRYFAEQLAKSLKKLGIEVEIIDPPGGTLSPEITTRILEFNPDFTLGFNSFLPNSKGKFLWDYLKIPHLQVLVDPAFYALSAIHSPYVFFSSVDREDCHWFKSNGVSKIFFWPHAVESDLSKSDQIDCQYDIVFLGTCTDYEGLRIRWKQVLKKEECEILECAIQRMFTQPSCSLMEALSASIEQFNVNPVEMDLAALFFYLDNYVRGKDRVELIRAIKNVDVHVFGEPSWNNPFSIGSWKEYLADQKNVILHPAVSYPESLKIMQQAKICLNSTPFFKHGSHERILNALMSCSLPLTTHNGFIDEFFKAGEDLFTYFPGHWNEVNEKIANVLGNESLRRAMIISGKQKVINEHTWDIRAKQLIEIAPKYLNQRIGT